MLKHHKDSPIRALVALFGEVEFDILRFNRGILLFYLFLIFRCHVLLFLFFSYFVIFLIVPIGFWEDKDNRRLFMDAVARTKQFNPKSAKGWYSLTKEDIIKLVCKEGGR